MKRGFLNSKKAVRSAERHAPDPPPVKCKDVQTKLEIGKEETGIYISPAASSKMRISILHAVLKHIGLDPKEKEDLRDHARVFATIPNKKPDGATLAEYPDNWTECIFIGHKPKHTILNTPNFPSRVPRPPKPRHRIGFTPTMGLGFFATCDLKTNDVIFAERPLVVTPRVVAVTAPDVSLNKGQLAQALGAEYEKVLEKMVGRMIPENRAALLALENSHTEDGSGPIFGILRTNGFGITFSREDEIEKDYYSAVFDQLSRINHSCTPNASADFDVASFSNPLKAIRDIKKGEEIFVSYCDCGTPTAARQQQLKSYGFQCTCRRCMDPASDALRERVAASTAQILTSKRDHAKVFANSVEWMKTIEAAGLQCLTEYGIHIARAETAASALGKRDKFMRYTCLRRDWFEAVLGKSLDGMI
ncbi:N-lysine methyltransferase SMYD2-B [Hypsizygus marmoreus]|uniref:N-lysine methyltransferase SMYD2-B n=1 Tax=Hypsizygus marmoreus TaxID=39966 RepID=A0A369K426_HYPMA|nr:N-lysine methyltransferase SMYD2-B [Hypsizygus marmoreus]